MKREEERERKREGERGETESHRERKEQRWRRIDRETERQTDRQTEESHGYHKTVRYKNKALGSAVKVLKPTRATVSGLSQSLRL